MQAQKIATAMRITVGRPAAPTHSAIGAANIAMTRASTSQPMKVSQVMRSGLGSILASLLQVRADLVEGAESDGAVEARHRQIAEPRAFEHLQQRTDRLGGQVQCRQCTE